MALTTSPKRWSQTKANLKLKSNRKYQAHQSPKRWSSALKRYGNLKNYVIKYPLSRIRKSILVCWVQRENPQARWWSANLKKAIQAQRLANLNGWKSHSSTPIRETHSVKIQSKPLTSRASGWCPSPRVLSMQGTHTNKCLNSSSRSSPDLTTLTTIHQASNSSHNLNTHLKLNLESRQIELKITNLNNSINMEFTSRFKWANHIICLVWVNLHLCNQTIINLYSQVINSQGVPLHFNLLTSPPFPILLLSLLATSNLNMTWMEGYHHTAQHLYLPRIMG